MCRQGHRTGRLSGGPECGRQRGLSADNLPEQPRSRTTHRAQLGSGIVAAADTRRGHAMEWHLRRRSSQATGGQRYDVTLEASDQEHRKSQTPPHRAALPPAHTSLPSRSCGRDGRKAPLGPNQRIDLKKATRSARTLFQNLTHATRRRSPASGPGPQLLKDLLWPDDGCGRHRDRALKRQSIFYADRPIGRKIPIPTRYEQWSAFQRIIALPNKRILARPPLQDANFKLVSLAVVD